MTKFQKAGENTISCICFIKNKKKTIYWHYEKNKIKKHDTIIFISNRSLLYNHLESK